METADGRVDQGCKPLMLFLLPGMDGTGLMFRKFVAQLRPAVDVHVVSYPIDETMTYVNLRTFVEARLAGCDRYVVLAESFSGPLAIALASDQPKGVAGLILCSTFAALPAGARYCRAPWLYSVACSPLALRMFGPWVLTGFADREVWHDLKKVLAGIPKSVLVKRLTELANIDVSDRLRSIRTPVLVLRGTRDRLIWRGTSNKLGKGIPNVKTVDLPGPHLLLQGMSNEAAETVKEFLNSIEGEP